VKGYAAQTGESRLMPLHSLAPTEAKATLEQLFPLLTADTARNALVLRGRPEDIAGAEARLRELDVAPPPAPVATQTEAVIIQHTDAAEVAASLAQAFPEARIVRQGQTLVITAPAPLLPAMRSLVPALDVAPLPIPERQVTYIYQCKYLNAVRAQQALQALLQGTQGAGGGYAGGGIPLNPLPTLRIAVAPEPVAPPPALYQPLLGGIAAFTGGAGATGVGGGGTATAGVGGAIGGGAAAGGGLNPSAPGTAGGGFGIVQPLDRSTRLILTGSAADVAAAQQILDEVDVAPPQVRIEAEVLEVAATSDTQLGITWDINNAGVTFSTLPTDQGGGFRFGKVPAVPGFPPAPGSVVPPGNGDIFTASVQALMNQGRAHILANPNVTVVDNEDASIFVGEEIPYVSTITQNLVGAPTANTNFLPVGVALLVRPRIHDDEITMKVHPVVSTLEEFVVVAPGQSAPRTAAREADTTVRVHDGDRLVIGGLFQENERRSVVKLPGLGDIPVVGQLFRSRTIHRDRTEIVVSLRVKVVNGEDEEPQKEEENGKDHGMEKGDVGKGQPQRQIELKGKARKPAPSGTDRGNQERKS
jgi:type II secretory pathway component GspD/PulD (secretin)